MQLQLNKETVTCLGSTAREVKNDEYTQELKLPDAMPDIGRVVGAWAQPLIRGKEWRGSGMSISGGLMAWVLYIPEDGTEVRTVDTWIPLQQRWEFEDSRRDGSMLADCRVAYVDARSVSARKIVVRAGISMLGQALEPRQLEYSVPGELTEDMQLQQQTSMLWLPVEAGEKVFSLEETLPAGACGGGKLLCYGAACAVTEKKVMADKLVFRGNVHLHMLCRGEDGKPVPADCDIAFSQYTELERSYGPEADAEVTPVLTSLELDRTEDGLPVLKAGLVGQYVIYDCKSITLVTDAYSTCRQVQIRKENWDVPVILERQQLSVPVQITFATGCLQAVDCCVLAEHPALQLTAEGVNLECRGNFRLLGYDESGMLQCENIPFTAVREIPADGAAQLLASCVGTTQPGVSVNPDGVQVQCEATVGLCTQTREGLLMVTGLELGEAVKPDPDRPSLILRRCVDGDLWKVAKETGSTVDAIREVNGITEPFTEEKILLIPVP